MGYMKFLIPSFLLFFLALCAQASESDLIGTYGIKEKGQIKEFVKISKEGGNFYLSEKRKNGAWVQEKGPMKPFTRSEFEKLLKHQISGPFDGLSYKGAAFFRVSSDFTEGKFTAKSGYVMLLLGLHELHKL